MAFWPILTLGHRWSILDHESDQTAPKLLGQRNFVFHIRSQDISENQNFKTSSLIRSIFEFIFYVWTESLDIISKFRISRTFDKLELASLVHSIRNITFFKAYKWDFRSTWIKFLSLIGSDLSVFLCWFISKIPLLLCLIFQFVRPLLNHCQAHVNAWKDTKW